MMFGTDIDETKPADSPEEVVEDSEIVKSGETIDEGKTAEVLQKPEISRYEVVVEQGKKQSRAKSILKNIAKDFLCVLLVCILFFVMFFNMEIPSESMEPTLQVGDRLLGWKLYLSVGRGDVVVFWSDEEDMYLIKRVPNKKGNRFARRNSISKRWVHLHRW